MPDSDGICLFSRIDPMCAIGDLSEHEQCLALLGCSFVDAEKSGSFYFAADELIHNSNSEWFGHFLHAYRALNKPGSEGFAGSVSKMISSAPDKMRSSWAETILAKAISQKDITVFDWEASAHELMLASKLFSSALDEELTHLMGTVCECCLPLPSDPSRAVNLFYSYDMALYLTMQVELDCNYIVGLIQTELSAYDLIKEKVLSTAYATELERFAVSISYLEAVLPVYSSVANSESSEKPLPTENELGSIIDSLCELTDCRISYEHNPCDQNLGNCVKAANDLATLLNHRILFFRQGCLQMRQRTGGNARSLPHQRICWTSRTRPSCPRRNTSRPSLSKGHCDVSRISPR